LLSRLELINKGMYYYTIYQITNKINGKIYIGSHKTKNLNDNYMGSGKYLTHAINKYGVENFKKQILHIYDNPDDMYAKEAELVNADFLAEANTYNLRIGGFGGWDYINQTMSNNERKRISSLGGKTQHISSDEQGRRISEGLKRALEKRGGKAWHNGTKGFTGRVHSEKTKQIMSEKAKERLKDPTVNSQYGTMWIHNPSTSENKKIKKGSIIPTGWIKGRKIKL